jgi:hypothetical protein
MKILQLPLFAVCLSALCLSQAQAQSNLNALHNATPLKPDGLQHITQSVGITEEEKVAFIPVYRAYQDELSELQKKNAKYAAASLSSNELSDDEAWVGLDEFLKFERDKVQLKKKFANRVRMVLPPKKAARYFIIESKMDAITNFDLADNK